MLDAWFEREAKPRLRGLCRLVRFADDFVMAFEDARSGRRMLDVLGKRLGRYGLTLHGTKTRYVDFRPERPRAHDRDTTFDFLGFTHVWGRSRRGRNVVRQITAKGRFTRAVKTVHEWCKANRHRPLDERCIVTEELSPFTSHRRHAGAAWRITGDPARQRLPGARRAGRHHPRRPGHSRGGR